MLARSCRSYLFKRAKEPQPLTDALLLGNQPPLRDRRYSNGSPIPPATSKMEQILYRQGSRGTRASLVIFLDVIFY